MPRLIAPYIIPWLLQLGARNHPGMIWSLGDRPQVALTFDDGPGSYTSGLLDVLAREKISATFFVLGDRSKRFPGMIRRIHAEGHALGLHGMEHRSFTTMSPEELTHSWRQQRELLQEMIPNLPPITLCRPPFGHAGEREFRLAHEYGLRLVLMTCLPGRHILFPPGWEEPPALMARRVAREIRPGGIITLHDGEDVGSQDKVYTQAAVSETAYLVAKAIRQRGLDIGTIDP